MKEASLTISFSLSGITLPVRVRTTRTRIDLLNGDDGLQKVCAKNVQVRF